MYSKNVFNFESTIKIFITLFLAINTFFCQFLPYFLPFFQHLTFELTARRTFGAPKKFFSKIFFLYVIVFESTRFFLEMSFLDILGHFQKKLDVKISKKSCKLSIYQFLGFPNFTLFLLLSPR